VPENSRELRERREPEYSQAAESLSPITDLDGTPTDPDPPATAPSVAELMRDVPTWTPAAATSPSGKEMFSTKRPAVISALRIVGGLMIAAAIMGVVGAFLAARGGDVGEVGRMFLLALSLLVGSVLWFAAAAALELLADIRQTQERQTELLTKLVYQSKT